MERYAWKATVLPGMLEEYIRRHDEIWQEMKDVLHQAGIRNYTIWNVGDELFGYYECDSVEDAARIQAASPVVDRWNEYMKDVMKMVATLKDAGYSIIWIEHVIETMVKSTDTLMCMAQGSNLVVGNPLEVMNSKLVEEVYLGGVEDDE